MKGIAARAIFLTFLAVENLKKRIESPPAVGWSRGRDNPGISKRELKVECNDDYAVQKCEIWNLKKRIESYVDWVRGFLLAYE